MRGIRVEAIHDGRRGLAQAFGGPYDLILLDVMLPGLDGFELLRQVRRRSHVPIIMLTARTTKADRIAGLDAGADDYLPKPFDPEELIARIRAVLRRVGSIRGPRAGDAGSQRRQAITGHARGLVRREAARADDHRVRHPGSDRPLGGPRRLSPRADRGDPPAAGVALGSFARRPCQPFAQKTGPARRVDPHSPRGRLPVPCRAARWRWDATDEDQGQVDLHQDRLVVRRHGRPLVGWASGHLGAPLGAFLGPRHDHVANVRTAPGRCSPCLRGGGHRRGSMLT